MAKFMMVYKGEATDMSTMTEDEVSAVMAAWGAWIQKLGPALVDVGTPFGPGTSVVDDGSKGSVVPLNGYSIVEADDMTGAQALTDNHPFLSEDTGDFAVDVYELLPAPMMD